MSKYFKTFWPFLVFLIIFFGIFYKIFTGLFPIPGDLLASFFFPYHSGGWTGYSTWITHKEFIAADVVRQLFPWRDLAIEIFKNGQFPLWNPYAFSGYPLLANIQSAVFYPLNILFFIFESKAAWIIYILFQPILAFIFMYLYIRSLSLSKYAALFCGLSFGFIGYMAVWFEWGVVGHSALWLPLILFGITKYFNNNSPKFLVLSSVGLACSVLAGHIQTTTYVAIITLLYYSYCAFSIKNNFTKRLKTLFFGGWFIFLAVGITAIQIFPSLELLRLSARDAPQSLEIFHRFQLPYSHLVTIFAPDFFGNPGVGNAWKSNYAEFIGYFGIVALIFAVIGCIYQRRNKLIYFFLFISGLALIFALPTPFSEALTKFNVPVLNTSSPARMLFIFQFSFVVLAGFGIDIYMSKKNFVWKSFFLLTLIYFVLWIFTMIAPFLPQIASVVPYLSIMKKNLALPTIILIASYILIYFGIKKNKYKIIAFFFLLILCAFEYQYFLYKFSPFSPIGYFFPKHRLVSDLQEMTPPHRIYGYGLGRIETNLPTQWRIYSPEGYDSLYIKRYGELLNASFPKEQELMRSDAILPESMPGADSHSKRVLLNILDVKHIIDKGDFEPKKWKPRDLKYSFDRFISIYQKDNFKVYENIHAIPRASVFYNFIVEKDRSKIIETLFDKKFPYNQKLILEETPPNFIPNNKGMDFSTAKIASDKPNMVEIEIDTKSDSLLFLSDNFYPGWNAYVDNMPTKIYRANYTFRAIPVKKGKHTVYLRYMPKSFIYGASISAVSLVLVFIILLKTGRKIKKG